jgi:GNAT superfamily N-acetyltransferase
VEHARVATVADIPALNVLWEMAIAELAGQRGGALLAASLAPSIPVERMLDNVLVDDDRLLVVGTVDGVEVGFASARCNPERSEAIGVIEAIYVEPGARQVGVGEAIIDVVIAWCAERGCRGVDAPALPGSRSAKAFFEDHGFVARLLVMHHPVSSSPPGPDA